MAASIGELTMPYFDRFDICAAHPAIETHYHVSGWLQGTPQ